MNGKGDKRRPTIVSYEEYERNWDRIFNSEIPKIPDTDLDTEKTDDQTGTARSTETD